MHITEVARKHKYGLTFSVSYGKKEKCVGTFTLVQVPTHDIFENMFLSMNP